MKYRYLDAYLAAARPDTMPIDTVFTDKVMLAIHSPLVKAVRKANTPKKRALFVRLRHLPKLAIVALAIGALLFIAGSTYAVVQTVKQLTHVTVKTSGTNDFGRQQLNVEFNSCDQEKKQGTTYELKRGSGLSADDGAKVLQAQCDLGTISEWIKHDPQSQQIIGDRAGPVTLFSPADTVKGVRDGTLVLEKLGDKSLTGGVRVVKDSTIVPIDTIQPGDTIIYFIPYGFGGPIESDVAQNARSVLVFKLPLAPRYYSLVYQSYINVRSACDGNPERTCLQTNHINHTTLQVATGGGLLSRDGDRKMRIVQGRVVSYDAGSIKINVGGGVVYTIQTPRSIIDQYNQTTVYGLASFDEIYAHTDPEDLKIKVGDSLDIYYQESDGEFATTLPWSQITSINLMVERTVKDLSVLQKY